MTCLKLGTPTKILEIWPGISSSNLFNCFYHFLIIVKIQGTLVTSLDISVQSRTLSGTNLSFIHFWQTYNSLSLCLSLCPELHWCFLNQHSRFTLTWFWLYVICILKPLWTLHATERLFSRARTWFLAGDLRDAFSALAIVCQSKLYRFLILNCPWDRSNAQSPFDKHLLLIKIRWSHMVKRFELVPGPGQNHAPPVPAKIMPPVDPWPLLIKFVRRPIAPFFILFSQVTTQLSRKTNHSYSLTSSKSFFLCLAINFPFCSSDNKFILTLFMASAELLIFFFSFSLISFHATDANLFFSLHSKSLHCSKDQWLKGLLINTL